jgi:DNA mismatch repair protein MutS2
MERMSCPANIPESSLDRFSRGVLEFQGVISLLREFISGPISAWRLDAIEPKTELEAIRRDLDYARDAQEFLKQNSRPSLASLHDPRPILEKLRIEGVSLEALEIYAVVELARAARDVQGQFAKLPPSSLRSLALSLPDLKQLVADLHGKILPDGLVDSSASPELARIRRHIEKLKVDLQFSLERILQRLVRDQLAQDSVVTLRNDRFVIPIRADQKRHVQGVVHGVSSSGATVYVEPLETLTVNNELVEYQDREWAEIRRILGEFSDRLRGFRSELGQAGYLLGELDLATAKAEFARCYDCCIPKFAADRSLVLKEVRHPLLAKSLLARRQKPVPLDVELIEPRSLMVISGPNTGGKTVTMKTVGISILMAQAGIPVAAQEANLPVFGRVLADIGDQQSIEANLSTFSAHVNSIQAMVGVAERNDLVILDEIGASTEPNEGAALAVAILEHFRECGAMTFVTTHHSRLKAYAAETPQAVNAAMEFDEATLQPTFRLLIGLPGKSSALDIAGHLGLAPNIVERARAELHPADAEAATLIAQLHEQKEVYERKAREAEEAEKGREARRAELEEISRRERAARLQELDKRFEQALRESERRWEETVAQLRSQLEAAKATKVVKTLDRKTSALRREAREEWNAQVLEALGVPAAASEEVAEARSSATLALGDRVRVRGLPGPAVVTALLSDNQVEVEVGRLRMRAKRDEVQVIGHAPSALRGARAVADHTEDIPAEINVIGQTAEEAAESVDRFLDRAYLSGRFRLRIIHGFGKGILRRTLHEMFAGHPHVEKFYAAPQNEGGSGATIVELKM